jgi:hypothetical protein
MVLRVGWSKNPILKLDGQNQTEAKVGWSKNELYSI